MVHEQRGGRNQGSGAVLFQQMVGRVVEPKVVIGIDKGGGARPAMTEV